MIHVLSFLAFFTILSQIGVVFEWSFKTLSNLSFIPVICSGLLFYFLKKKNYEFPIDETLINRNKHDNIFAIMAIVIAFAICILPIPSWTDEAFFSNVENHALQNPDLPYLKYDGMFGEPDLPLLSSTYKVQSYQILSAVISYWFDIPNLLPRHIFFPLVATALLLIAWSNLLKLFIPERWQLGLFFLMVLALLEGGHRGFTYFSIPRFVDGKGLLAFIIMPLVLYYSILFFRKNSFINWLYLLLIQIAAVGLSSSALFLLPIQIGVICMCYWRPNFDDTKKCIALCSSCFYVVITALIMKFIIGNSSYYNSLSSTEDYIRFYRTYMFDWTLSVFGGTFYSICINTLSVLIAWKLYKKNDDLKRVLILLPLIMYLIILNPLLFPVFSQITSMYTYPRLAFILPIGLFFVIMMISLVNKQLENKKNWNHACSLVFIIFLYAFPWMVSSHPYIGMHFTWDRSYYFEPRFRPNQYEMAIDVINKSPADKRILAPSEISTWISASEYSPKLVAINTSYRRSISYLHMMKKHFDEKDFHMRRELHYIIGGHTPDFDEEEMSLWLKELDVGSVSFFKYLPYTEKIESVLSRENYQKVFLDPYFSLWVKE